jgi:hypothetical protein
MIDAALHSRPIIEDLPIQLTVKASLWRTRTPYHGRIAERISPCFPSYLFVLLDVAGEALKAATYTRHCAPASRLRSSDRGEERGGDRAVRGAELDGASVTGFVTPGSRLRVYRGALAGQAIECLTVDDERGLVRALWDCFN